MTRLRIHPAYLTKHHIQSTPNHGVVGCNNPPRAVHLKESVLEKYTRRYCRECRYDLWLASRKGNGQTRMLHNGEMKSDLKIITRFHQPPSQPAAPTAHAASDPMQPRRSIRNSKYGVCGSREAANPIPPPQKYLPVGCDRMRFHSSRQAMR